MKSESVHELSKLRNMVTINLESRLHIYKNISDEVEIMIHFRDYTYWFTCIKETE